MMSCCIVKQTANVTLMPNAHTFIIQHEYKRNKCGNLLLCVNPAFIYLPTVDVEIIHLFTHYGKTITNLNHYNLGFLMIFTSSSKCLNWMHIHGCVSLTHPWCLRGPVTMSVTIQPPWRPTWPRPDGGREHLVTVVTRLGCNTPSSEEMLMWHTKTHISKKASQGKQLFIWEIIIMKHGGCGQKQRVFTVCMSSSKSFNLRQHFTFHTWHFFWSNQPSYYFK